MSTSLYYVYFWLLLHYIPKQNIELFTPYIFPDTQMYSVHFECLAGQKKSNMHAIIKRTSLVIHTASDLVDSLNMHASFVNYVWVLEYSPGYP
jgi:hypothetical protein